MRWLLIFWMFVISAIAYLDRVNISIAGTPIRQEYHFSNEQLGYVFSSFVLGYALFQAVGGRLADRFGPRWVLAAGVLWWGVFTSISAAIPAGIANVLVVFIAVRFLLGIGEAVVYPSSNRLVANWIPSSERGIANGIIFSGVGIGAGVTSPLITHIMINYGWRWSFWFSAILGTIAGLVWLFLARDTPREHPWTSERERAYIAAGLPSSAAQLASHTGVPWRSIFRSREVLLISASYFAYGYAAYIFFTWFFLYLSTVRHLDLKKTAYYSMLPPLMMAACSPLGGWIADRLSKRYGRRVGRCGVAVVGIALAAVFIALGTLANTPEMASIILAGGAGALYLSQSSFWAVTADLAGPAAGSVSGIMNMGGQLGGALTASLTPWIANNYGWTASFLTAAALCAVGSVLWLFVNPERELEGVQARRFESVGAR